MQTVILAKKALFGHLLDCVQRVDHEGWLFEFGNGAILTTHWPWRVVSNTKIEVASGDDGLTPVLAPSIDSAAEAQNLLACQLVTDVQERPVSGDLVVRFGTHLQLELLSNSSLRQGWRITHGLEDAANGFPRAIRPAVLRPR